MPCRRARARRRRRQAPTVSATAATAGGAARGDADAETPRGEVRRLDLRARQGRAARLAGARGGGGDAAAPSVLRGHRRAGAARPLLCARGSAASTSRRADDVRGRPASLRRTAARGGARAPASNETPIQSSAAGATGHGRARRFFSMARGRSSARARARAARAPAKVARRAPRVGVDVRARYRARPRREASSGGERAARVVGARGNASRPPRSTLVSAPALLTCARAFEKLERRVAHAKRTLRAAVAARSPPGRRRRR